MLEGLQEIGHLKPGDNGVGLFHVISFGMEMARFGGSLVLVIASEVLGDYFASLFSVKISIGDCFWSSFCRSATAVAPDANLYVFDGWGWAGDRLE